MKFRPVAGLGALALGGLCAAQAHALSLGALDVRSALGQPLDARLTVQGAEEVTVGSACVTVAEADNGLPGPGPVRVRASATPGGWIVHLRGVSGVNEPALQFAVRFECGGERLSREYTVLLDLPAEATEGVASPIGPVVAEAATAETRRGNSRRDARRSDARRSDARRTHPRHGDPRSADAAGAVRPEAKRHGNAARRASPATDVVKLETRPRDDAYSRREAELLDQAVDQVSRMRRMEVRIETLQTLVQRLQAYVPEASAAGAGPVSVPARAAAPASAAAPRADSSRVAPVPAAIERTGAANARGVEAPGPRSFSWPYAAAGLALLAALGLGVARRRSRAAAAAQWDFRAGPGAAGTPRPVRPPLAEAAIDRDERSPLPLPLASVLEPDAEAVPTKAVPRTEPELDFVEVRHGAVAEQAQWLLEHGEEARALELLREEIRVKPEQTELWMLLFGYLHRQRKKLEFVTLAHRFRRGALGTDPWRQVCALGAQLDPQNRLFAGCND